MKAIRIILLLLLISVSASGQSLRGTVTEASTGETIPLANVVVKFGDTIIDGATTDFDGNYNVSPLSPGVYTVEFSFIGFETKKIQRVKIKSQKASHLNVSLEESGGNLFICGGGSWDYYRKPLIDPFHSGATYSSEDINEMPIMR